MPTSQSEKAAAFEALPGSREVTGRIPATSDAAPTAARPARTATRPASASSRAAGSSLPASAQDPLPER